MRFGVVGYGVVGRGLCERLEEFKEPFKIYLRDSSKFHHSLYKFGTQTLNPKQLVESCDVIFEAICGSDGLAWQIASDVLSSGKVLITSNKKLICDRYNELVQLQRENPTSQIYLEASVCGGVPLYKTLFITASANQDSILKVEGIMNGSTNYYLCRAIELVETGNKVVANKVVASGAPEVVASGAPEVVASGAPEVVASGAPEVVASGAPKVVASGAPEVVASGAPGVVSTGVVPTTTCGGGGDPLSQILCEMKDLGYLEADPSMDLDGFDAAYKLRILASAVLGWDCSKCIEICGVGNLIYEDFEFMKKNHFLAIRLVASLYRNDDGVWCAEVAPRFITKHDSLFEKNLGGQNTIIVHTKDLGELVFKGPGAGKSPTVNAMISDSAFVQFTTPPMAGTTFHPGRLRQVTEVNPAAVRGGDGGGEPESEQKTAEPQSETTAAGLRPAASSRRRHRVHRICDGGWKYEILDDSSSSPPLGVFVGNFLS